MKSSFPAMSFAASANVVARLRAKPVFVDIDLYTRNIDLDQVPAAITPKTRAIMPVHFAGLPVDMDGLYGLAARTWVARGGRRGACHRLASTRTSPSAASAIWWCSAFIRTRT